MTPEQIAENKRRFVEQRDKDNAEKEPQRQRPAVLVDYGPGQNPGPNADWPVWEYR